MTLEAGSDKNDWGRFERVWTCPQYFMNVFESMHVLILALRRWIIKKKFAYLFFWLIGLLIVLIERFWEKRSGGGGLVALRFFGYLKKQLELLIFYECFISKRHT